MVSPGWCWSAGAQGCGMVCPVAGPKPGGRGGGVAHVWDGPDPMGF